MILAGLALGGCASTQSFSQPIASFADAADKTATSFEAINKDGTDQLNAIRFGQALDAKHVAVDGCKTDSDDCRLLVTVPNLPPATGTAVVPVYVDSLLPKTVKFVDGIRDYAKALQDLQKADATGDVQAAFGSALGAAGTLATAFNAPTGAIITAINKPLSSVAGWAFGQWQESMKAEAIKRAVDSMDDVIQQAKPQVNAEINLVETARLAKLEVDVHDADDAFSWNQTSANLKAEIDAASQMAAVIKVRDAGKDSGLFDTLANAHAKLKAAVDNPKPDLADVMAAMTAFATQAQNVQNIVQELKGNKTN